MVLSSLAGTAPFTAAPEHRSREDWLRAVEQARRAGVARRRAYYDGRQYDPTNERCLQELASQETGFTSEEKQVARALALWNQELPEHLRVHEYSTQIAESVDFIANRLSKRARITAADPAVDQVLTDCLDASPELSGTADDEQYTLVNVIREAGKVGDVPALVRWNPVDGVCWLEFWDAETVELRFTDGRPDLLEQVIVEQVDWIVPPGEDAERAVTVRRVWQVETRVVNEARVAVEPGVPAELRVECAERVFWVRDTDDLVLLAVIWWGVPFLPWWPVRGDKKTLRATRGESLITEQTMKTADRYNAVEQVSWLIARYNSHGNLAVIGDQALLMQKKTERLSKDIADVLLFPGGTNLVGMSLPTDPQMIEHQKDVLLDALFGSMGLTRVDQKSLEGLGGVSGYSLEILNEKSDGTFDRVRQQLVRDVKRLLNLVLDCHAFWSRGTLGVLAPAAPAVVLGIEPPAGYAEIDPEALYPNRAIEVVLGSGYIVDDARVRDDFLAKLISQQEALRLRGYNDEQIELILAEQQEASEQAAAAQRAAFGETGTEAGVFGTTAGQTTGSSGREPVGRAG